MNFNADRLAKLAGLPSGQRRSLNEAGNRSQHDDSSVSDEAEWRYGKNQLAEAQDDEAGFLDSLGERQKYGGNKGDESESREDFEESQKYGGNKGDESRSRRDYMEEMVHIDENMLKREIKRMRQERLQENELRKVIRAEIGNIMSGIKKSKTTRNRRKGKRDPFSGITSGFPGPGFR
tara:strand:+ start:2268 stop:2801 length:534 start_codon:yes stop_codon:yes gene_type:complete